MMERNASRSDWLLFFCVLFLSVAANLPESWAAQWAIDRDYFLIALLATVVLALIRYLKFLLFLVVVILTVGANLPAELAQKLNIDQTILLFALVMLVTVSFINYIWKIVPTGIEAKQQKVTSTDATKVLMTAARRGEISMLDRLVQMGVDVNATLDGWTPLMVAADAGSADAVHMLLKAGANTTPVDNDGRSAADLALLKGQTRIALAIRQTEKRRHQAVDQSD